MSLAIIPTKGYLENCIIFLYDKNLIVNNTVDKKAAHTLFKEEFIKSFGSHNNFNAVLKGWEMFAYTLHGKDETKIYFTDRLQKILKNKGNIKKAVKKKVKKKTEQLLPICSTCDIKFTSARAYNEHISKDKQHYFRTLYMNKSKLLKSTSQHIITIEINKGSGCGPEVLISRKNVDSETPVIIANKSNDAYTIEDITELHFNRNAVSIAPYPLLPVYLKSGSVLSLKIKSFFSNNDSQLFVVVFTVRNLRSNVRIDVLKEVTIHINSDVFDELMPTVPYTQYEAVEKLIEDGDFIPAGEPRTSAFVGSVLPLKLYKVPACLKLVLNAGLKAYDGMTLDEQKYLHKVLILLKGSSAKEYLTKKNYHDLLDLLLHMEDHQMSRDIRHYDMETKEIIQVRGRNLFELKVPGLAEHRPSLLPGDSVFIKSKYDKDTYQGIVKETKESSVVLRFSKKFGDVYVNQKLFSVTYGYNRCNIRAEHRSVELIHKHKAVSHFFAKHTGEKALKNYNFVWFNDKIKDNPEQQQAVVHILSGTSYPAPYLIFGPPGTGKTMTIIEAISQVWKLKPATKMLVCAPSNSVANEIACRLIAYVPPSELFRYLSLSFHLASVPEKIMPCVNYDEGDYFHPTFHELLEFRIVITTLSNASRLVSYGVPADHFSYVFIDESGHATETETLIPIAGILTTDKNQGALNGQVVLAGDPQQLGPVIHSALAKQYGFGKSMLERMMTTLKLYKKDENGRYNARALTKLLCNYRSHPSILKLPNKLFYENELIAKGDGLVKVAVNWKHLPNPKVPVVFHSVIGSDQREANSPSYFNIQEVEVVVDYLKLLIGTRLNGMLIKQDHIGIVAPYRKQVEKLRKACEKRNWNTVTVGSVEQFQGQERLIIIISTVRSQPKLLKFDSKFHLGFLNNPKRFNVAVTRAKALLIVVGNPNLLQHEKYWKEFIKYCKGNNCFTGTAFDFSTNNLENMYSKMKDLRVNDVLDDTINFSRGNI